MAFATEPQGLGGLTKTSNQYRTLQKAQNNP